MNKIKENKILSAIVFFVLASILAVIVRPLLDWFMCENIFHTKFYYAEWKHVVQPVVIAFLVAFLVYLPLISCGCKNDNKKKK